MSDMHLTLEEYAKDNITHILGASHVNWTRFTVHIEESPITLETTLWLRMEPNPGIIYWNPISMFNSLEVPRTVHSRTTFGSRYEPKHMLEGVLKASAGFAVSCIKEYLCWALDHAKEVAAAKRASLQGGSFFFGEVYPFGLRMTDIPNISKAIDLIDPEDLPKYLALAQQTDPSAPVPETEGVIVQLLRERLERV